MISEQTKKLIDDIDYESMLYKWRYAKAGYPMFQGEIGDYFAEVMRKKRREIGDEGHAAASKNVGWDR